MAVRKLEVITLALQIVDRQEMSTAKHQCLEGRVSWL